jgi:hypothetical protein
VRILMGAAHWVLMTVARNMASAGLIPMAV